MPDETQTIAITNFSGRLTRYRIGELNSGFAKFNTSFGYDPFTQEPMQLRWLPTPSSVTGIGTTNVVLGGVSQVGGITSLDSAVHTYVVDTARKIHKIARPSALVNSVVGTQSVIGSATSTQWGASLAIFGQTAKLYLFLESTAPQEVGSLVAQTEFNMNGFASVIGNPNFTAGNFHPNETFAGKLLFGNGPTIGAIDATNTIISSVFTISTYWGNEYSQLFPGLRSTDKVKDLAVSNDGNYLHIAVSDITNERLGSLLLDRANGSPVQGTVYGWNGVDGTVTTALNVPFGGPTAILSYLQSYILFMNDGYGACLSDGVRKIVSLPNNQSPFPGAVDINGNFVTWMAAETVVPSVANGKFNRSASLYYYGAYDDENPVGLYRLLRFDSPLANGFVYNVPYYEVVSNQYASTNISSSSVISTSFPRHYFSLFNTSPTVQSSSSAGSGGLYVFYPSSNNSQMGAPQRGVYETQTQLFSKRIGITQIRVYTETVGAGNSFQLDVIDTDDLPIENGTFTYTYGDPIDLGQRINFNINTAPMFGFAIRITNLGTTNMTFKKIEIDYSEKGK